MNLIQRIKINIATMLLRSVFGESHEDCGTPWDHDAKCFGCKAHRAIEWFEYLGSDEY